MNREFCTCEHIRCPRHLCNSEDGCTSCIEKNLREHEIPNCFFNNAGLSKDRKDDYYETFARMILDNEKKD